MTNYGTEQHLNPTRPPQVCQPANKVQSALQLVMLE